MLLIFFCLGICESWASIRGNNTGVSGAEIGKCTICDETTQLDIAHFLHTSSMVENMLSMRNENRFIHWNVKNVHEILIDSPPSNDYTHAGR